MKTFDTPAPITVSLELGVGDVQIDASDRTDTTVEVRPSDPLKKADVAAAEQTQVEFGNGRLLIQAPKGGWRQWVSWRNGESVDVRIGLPLGPMCGPTPAWRRSAPRAGSARSGPRRASAT